MYHARWWFRLSRASFPFIYCCYLLYFLPSTPSNGESSPSPTSTSTSTSWCWQLKCRLIFGISTCSFLETSYSYICFNDSQQVKNTPITSQSYISVYNWNTLLNKLGHRPHNNIEWSWFKTYRLCLSIIPLLLSICLGAANKQFHLSQISFKFITFQMSKTQNLSKGLGKKMTWKH